MNTILRFAVCLTACLLMISSAVIAAADRGDELKEEMWNSTDKDFRVVKIPEKWAGKSAVIIAQTHRFEYRQRAVTRYLKLSAYSHYRIKLIDKNAVNEYSEISFKSSNYRDVRIYVGFKVVKPDGREVVVDPKSAVKMERSGSDGRYGYNKIAIPNLEPGDIIDYYLCEEEDRMIGAMIEFFDPVILNLPQDYPVMKQKFQFKVKRRCYINLRSVNGAPELKLVNDEENDEQYYSLEDSDREGLEDTRWLYPNRDVPTIKFRAAFAFDKAVRQLDVLLSEPGEVKNKVTADELADVTRTMVMTNMIAFDSPDKYMKKNYKGPQDNFEIAKAAYYFLRHNILNANETLLLADREQHFTSTRNFIYTFSTYLKDQDIPHDIVVTASRQISSIDDVIFENELEFLIRVKKGSEYMYFAPYSMYTVPGTIPQAFQGADAYALDGLVRASKWEARRITIPATNKDQNLAASTLNVKLTEDLKQVEVSVQRTVTGADKLYSQYRLVDVYDAIAEDNKTYEPYVYTYPPKQKKQYEALQKEYQQKRATVKTNALKEMLESDYEFALSDPGNLIITQLGRDDKAPAIVYSFTFKSEDLVKKTGPNYLIDVGKLIEGQVSIESDALKRDQNIYFPNTRSFRYTIMLDIPPGYQVQGLDKLATRVENSNGGFTSTAKEVNGKVIIETYKHYDVMYAPKTEWSNIVAFINAAHGFTQQKLLLRKK